MLIAFVPVLHKGYINLFKKYPDTLGILGADVIADFTALTRDCRMVEPEAMKLAIESLKIFSSVRVLSKSDLAEIAQSMLPIVMPDEDVSREIAKQHFADRTVFESIFLRWDGMRTLRENIAAPDRKISSDDFARSMIRLATAEATKSSDWWRQVGTAIVKDGVVIALSHNRHLPTDYHLDVEGDPRTNFDAGVRIDLSTAIHSEALAVAQSAKAGTPLNGADAFVTTFPCPNCARLLAEAGIKTVYYNKGYSLLDAEEILKAYGIEIVLVEMN
ncbi:MAG: deaminase [Patescibacteria group bacterium]